MKAEIRRQIIKKARFSEKTVTAETLLSPRRILEGAEENSEGLRKGIGVRAPHAGLMEAPNDRGWQIDRPPRRVLPREGDGTARDADKNQVTHGGRPYLQDFS